MLKVAKRAAAAVLAMAALAGTANADVPADPAATVNGFYAQLLDTMKNAKALGAKGRFDKLAPVIASTFDAPSMAKIAAGPAWDAIPAPQQQAVAAAFQRMMTATYASRFDDFGGEKFEVVGVADQTPDKVVQTRLVQGNGKPVTLNYLVRKTPAGWRIEDVYLDGTISELAGRRAEFGTILKSGGADALIKTLQAKSDKLLGGS
jgi:phospholipid transport system substrate-binding protein